MQVCPILSLKRPRRTLLTRTRSRRLPRTNLRSICMTVVPSSTWPATLGPDLCCRQLALAGTVSHVRKLREDGCQVHLLLICLALCANGSWQVPFIQNGMTATCRDTECKVAHAILPAGQQHEIEAADLLVNSCTRREQAIPDSICYHVAGLDTCL